MIIELYGEAHELKEPFRIYGTEEEFIRLSVQAMQAAKKASPGWVEIDLSNSTHIVTAKPQDPVVQDWVRKDKDEKK